MSERMKVREYQQRLHRLMERVGARDLRIETGRSHSRNPMRWTLEFDVGSWDVPDWRRMAYWSPPSLHDADDWTGAALLGLLRDAEERVDRDVANAVLPAAVSTREPDNE